VGQAFGLLCCVGVMLFAVLAAAVLLFRLACAMAGVPRPSFFKAAWIVAVTSVVLSVAEGIMAAIVRAVYQDLDYPLWEAGLVTFFLGLPIDLAVASGIHAAFLRVKFGKAVEVWFAHRLILLSIVMAVAGVAAVAVLASNN
jgi:hypothetical protein